MAVNIKWADGCVSLLKVPKLATSNTLHSNFCDSLVQPKTFQWFLKIEKESFTLLPIAVQYNMMELVGKLAPSFYKLTAKCP